MKKTPLASAIALALAGISVNIGAVTSTKDVAVVCDKTQVRAGEIVNCGIMALNAEEGPIDRFGEQDGSTLIATVSSKLCKVILGEYNPGEVEAATTSEGEFSAFSVVDDVDQESGVKYIRVTQGVGKFHIECPIDVQYENAEGNSIQEEISLLLQQRYVSGGDEEGGDGRHVEWGDIAGIGVRPHNDCPPDGRNASSACPFHADPIRIDILPPSIDPGGLDIVAFVPPVPIGVSAHKAVHDCLAEAIIPPTTDRYGQADCYMDSEPDGFFDNEDGIQGVTTVGMRGGQIAVRADNSSISGTVKVTLRQVADLMAMENPGDPQKGMNGVRLMKEYLDRDAEGKLMPKEYTYTARMVQGVAILTLDDRLTEAGTYYIEAEFAVGDDADIDEDGDGYAYSSVDMVYRDTLKVVPTGIPTGLQLSSVKQRMLGNLAIDDGGLPGTPLKVTFLDQYGNPTVDDPVATPAGAFGNVTTIEIKDANNVANNDLTDTGVIALKINPGEKSSMPVSGDDWLGNEPGELLATQGLINLTAKAIGLEGKTLTSNPVSINVQSAWLQADPIFETPPRAGNDFDAFKVVAFSTEGVATHPGRIAIKNISTEEASLADPNTSTARSGIVEARFLQATVLGSQTGVQDTPWHHKTHNWFLVSDEQGRYSEVLYMAPTGIGSNAGTSMKLYDAHSQDPLESWEKVSEDGTITVVEDGSLTKVFENTSRQVVGTETIIPKGPKGRGETKVLTIPEFAFKMTDCFGNPVTVNPEPAVQPGDKDKGTGTFTVSSSNCTVTYRGAEGGAFGIPYRDYFLTAPSLTRSNVSCTYNTDLFKGEDRIELTFTKPGLGAGPCRGPGSSSVESGADPFVITTTVGNVDKEQKLEAYLDAVKIPINSEVPLALESLVEDGEDKNGNTLYRLFSDHENVLVELTIDVGENEKSWLPDIREIIWINGVPVETPVTHGNLLDLTSLLTGTDGKKVFAVHGGPVPRKPITLTFTSVDDPSLSAAIVIEVVETVAETRDRECSDEYPFACETEEACTGIGAEWVAEFEQCRKPDIACEERLGIFFDDVCYESDPSTDKADKASRLIAANTANPEYGGPDAPEAMFAGGWLNKTKGSTTFEKGSIESPALANLGDQIMTMGVIKVRPQDIGKEADIVAVGLLANDGGQGWYQMTECTDVTGNLCPNVDWRIEYLPADEKGFPLLSELKALRTVTLTGDTLTVELYEGNFGSKGLLQGYFGYIPKNENQSLEVIFNAEPIILEVTE